MNTKEIIKTANGHHLAFTQLAGKAPGVIFCTGFMSNQNGIKALAIENFCRERNQAFIRFDYFGHGESEGNFAEGSISFWRDDLLTILDELTTTPQILVGSSMGGWLALLATLSRPQKIAGIVTIAVAADFTEYFIWDKLTPELKATLMQGETLSKPCPYSDGPYIITKNLIEDARQYLLLNRTLPIQCPVRLLHGMQDLDIPWQNSLNLTEKLQSKDVRLTLIKDGDHRLARESDLLLLQQNLAELLSI